MRSPLTAARDELGEVVTVEALGGGMLELTARLPHLAAHTQPGQFAQLRCASGNWPLLRRPFSVAWTDGELASFVFAAVGEGTRRLSLLQPGDPLAALGPLGRGFRVVEGAGDAICVSGGLGCAPFPLLIRELRRRKLQRVLVLSGAASSARLYPADRFRRGDGSVEVVEVTVDGSQGRVGLVVDALQETLTVGATVYACGPNPMLAALQSRLQQLGSPQVAAQVSIEAPMGCGYGTCLGCALPVGEVGAIRWALCCRDGPVMDIAEISWEELMRLPPAHVA